MKVLAALLLLSVALCFTTSASALPRSSKQDPRGILENIENAFGNPCPNSWTRFNNYCYLVSTTSTYSWSQAQAHCRSLSADLVKINSVEENEFVLSLVRKLAPSLKQIWIGLKWNTNGFYWIDLSVPVYKNWAPQHPNGNANEPCVQMWINNGQHLPKYASGYWNDIDCHYRSDFPNGIVCKKLP
ncbi:CD209 antigen-like protein D [Pocillopora damicornis]|uniref:CD209 antigen-like protein D n=1 Tax=Pocillopora damicornis TaxID=46731 RepID=UPI000F552BFC|nr:CD209 antigen-like protein D [Pocillopora damicornis]